MSGFVNDKVSPVDKSFMSTFSWKVNDMIAEENQTVTRLGLPSSIFCSRSLMAWSLYSTWYKLPYNSNVVSYNIVTVLFTT